MSYTYNYFPADRETNSLAESMLKDPTHNAAVLAAIAGESRITRQRELDEYGKPGPGANPWLQQWWRDIEL
eukprot:6181865-Heterocapsa_arctica.AAC.1